MHPINAHRRAHGNVLNAFCLTESAVVLALALIAFAVADERSRDRPTCTQTARQRVLGDKDTRRTDVHMLSRAIHAYLVDKSYAHLRIL